MPVITYLSTNMNSSSAKAADISAAINFLQSKGMTVAAPMSDNNTKNCWVFRVGTTEVKVGINTLKSRDKYTVEQALVMAYRTLKLEAQMPEFLKAITLPGELSVRFEEPAGEQGQSTGGDGLQSPRIFLKRTPSGGVRHEPDVTFTAAGYGADDQEQIDKKDGENSTRHLEDFTARTYDGNLKLPTSNFRIQEITTQERLFLRENAQFQSGGTCALSPEQRAWLDAADFNPDIQGKLVRSFTEIQHAALKKLVEDSLTPEEQKQLRLMRERLAASTSTPKSPKHGRLSRQPSKSSDDSGSRRWSFQSLRDLLPGYNSGHSRAGSSSTGETGPSGATSSGASSPPKSGGKNKA